VLLEIYRMRGRLKEEIAQAARAEQGEAERAEVGLSAAGERIGE